MPDRPLREVSEMDDHRADTDNTETISIKIPAENLLTKDSLKEIMRKISREEEL